MSVKKYYNALMHILKASPALHKTAKGVFKQVAWTVAGAVAGGTLGGPAGALVGCIVGGVVGYGMSDKYKSLIKVLQNLSDKEKAELVKRVQELVESEAIDALERFILSDTHRATLINLLKRETSKMHGNGALSS